MKDTLAMCLSVLILCSLFIAVTEAKFCYQCADAKTDGECFKMENYETAWRFGTNYTYYAQQNITRHDYVKDCTDWGGMCYNEHIKEAGKTMSYIRGCTGPKYDDGFSVHVDTTYQSDNQTVCRLVQMTNVMVVCWTVCADDMCNGPKIVPNSAATTYVTFSSFIYLCLYFVLKSIHVT